MTEFAGLLADEIGVPVDQVDRHPARQLSLQFVEWDNDIDKGGRSCTSTVRGWDSMPAIVN